MKNNYFILLICIFSLFFVLTGKAQDKHDHTHGHSHDNHKIELGIANSMVYFVNEKEVGYGLHVHLVRKISQSKFGVGLAYERIFDEHKHNTIGIVGSYTPVDRLHFAVSPGISFEGGHSSEKSFATHFETSYEFQVGDFHIGPLVEVAYDSEDVHISLGMHIGLGFN
uniref:hypothetical protein n=1 Tax=uncultured Draconibacterium sp. TaxID=1573823 RepID=UPI003216A67F